MIVGERDTIAAIATPAGSGGVGIVRLSGPASASILARLLGRRASAFEDRKLVFGVARDHRGARLDEVLAVVMRGPRSFTGEDVGEVQGHGGAVNMARLLRAVLRAGARLAEAGEFTRRAFENGRLDLTRAEAVLDVIEAGSERGWRIAQAQLDGVLGARVGRLRELATSLLAEVEACIDFPEEDVEYSSHLEVAQRATALGREVGRLGDSFVVGRALTEGVAVAIVGPVNSGKSSLFNRLADRERAIVTAEPGTTRDFVEARLVWDGVPVTLIDTAGERVADSDTSRAEVRGMEVGRKRSAEADLRIVVHEAPGAEAFARGADDEEAQGDSRRDLHVVTKGDLLPAGSRPGLPITSAVAGTGIGELRKAVVEEMLGRAAESDDGAVVTSERQRALLERAADRFQRAVSAVDWQAPTEIVALELREAVAALAEITGDRVGEEVLDALFARFCIGK